MVIFRRCNDTGIIIKNLKNMTKKIIYDNIYKNYCQFNNSISI